MKNILFIIFRVLIALVLIGKILNWFFNFSDELNQMLNLTMYTLIGIAYLAMAYVWDGKLLKIVIMICGTFLIIRSFLSDSIAFDIAGIICILMPMLIARFTKYGGNEITVPES